MKFYDFGDIIESDTQFVIFGIPWDYLTSIEAPNSAIAPRKIRDVTEHLGLTTELGYEIPNIKAVDVGDIKVESSNVDKNLKEIITFMDSIYQQKSDVIPVMIGGDHFCSLNTIKAVGDHFGKKDEFGVLIFDAHLDFYDKWDKSVYSHATITHRVYDLQYISNKNLLVVGTRDIDIPELEIANRENIKYLEAYKLMDLGMRRYMENIIEFFTNSSITTLYISIDIDALDPSIAPGTGYAIPGGFSYRDIWKILKEITEYFNIVGFDLVEVAPNLDLENKMTCILAAKLIVEFMYFIRSNNL
ncbi:MAG: arginase family protein [Candidatus Lokiarchaeota archaeon]|nr:arginase family protein [Candidatus Lokiarchaeota archaeon]